MTNQTYKPDASMDFNLALDVLYGCKWSCDGCHVSKEGQSDKELLGGDDKKIISLVDDFVANGFNPKILILNATYIHGIQHNCNYGVGELSKNIETV